MRSCCFITDTLSIAESCALLVFCVPAHTPGSGTVVAIGVQFSLLIASVQATQKPGQQRA